MQFRDIVGNRETIGHLLQMVEHNRLSHAILFAGKEGSGALPLANAFAQYLVCEKAGGRKETTNGGLFGELPEPVPFPDDSCGICAACQKAAALIHPDIHYTIPTYTTPKLDKPVSSDYIREFRKFIVDNPYANTYDWLQYAGADNKQGNITKYECDEILRNVNLKSFEGGYKVQIIWMAELLGLEGNRLLKMIEEPPLKTLILLVTENDKAILPTIISRVQTIRIKLPVVAEVKSFLMGKQGAAEAQAQQAATLSGGNVREAIIHLNHTEENWDEMLRAWLNAILMTGPEEQVKFVENISKTGREKQKQFLQFFLLVVELAVRLQAIGAQNMDAAILNGHASMTDLAMRLNKICDVGQLEAIMEEVDKGIYYIERNALPKLLFHSLTIRFYHIISNKSVILIN